jgi:hypothetical protein
MKNFIHRPIPRLLRYELLLKYLLDETPAEHEDLDTIPVVLDVIKGLGKETEPGIASAKRKVELWRYNANLVFKVGEHIVCCSRSIYPNGGCWMLTFSRIWTYSTRIDH